MRFYLLVTAFSVCWGLHHTHIFAQETPSFVPGKIDREMLQIRKSVPEPDFLTSGSSVKWAGVYFGVGFRRVYLTLGNGISLTENDPAFNGVGFNLGLFWNEQTLEYERQVSIVDSQDKFSFKGDRGSRLEVIQNTLAYTLFPRVLKDLYLHYGAGLQATQTRFAATETGLSYIGESAVALLAGAVYFITPNLMLMYRHSRSANLALNRTGQTPFLKETRLHSLFLDYYFPL